MPRLLSSKSPYMCVYLCVLGAGSLFLVHLYTDALAPCHSILSGKEPHYMSHLGQAFDFVFLISFMTCSVKFKFSECSQRRNFISLPILSTHYYTLPIPPPHALYPLLFMRPDILLHYKKKKKRFSKKFPQPSFIPFSKCSLCLFSHPFLLPFSLLEEGVFFPFSCQVLWSRIVVPKVSTGPKEGGRPLPILKLFDIDLQL